MTTTEMRDAERVAWQNYKGQVQREMTYLLKDKKLSPHLACSRLSDYAKELGAVWLPLYRQIPPVSR